MRALHVRVLSRLSRPDVNQLDPPVQAPGDEAAAGELGPIIGADAFRHAALGNDLFRRTNNAHAAQRRVRFQCQALASVALTHRKRGSRRGPNRLQPRQPPVSPTFAITETSASFLLRFAVSYELDEFGRAARNLFRSNGGAQ